MEEKYHNLKLGERGAKISIAAYLVLSSFKIMIGYMSNSEALKADGFNNATDIIASVAVLIGLKVSQKPPDSNHPYGHWRAETVASLIASFIMMTVGIQVFYGAILSTFSGETESPEWSAAWTALIGCLVMLAVYRYNSRLAKKINSQSVHAAAKDNLSDAFVSIGTLVGIAGAKIGLPWLDPLAAVIIGLIICKTAWDIFRETSLDLTDAFDEKELAEFKRATLNVDGVKEVRNIKARRYGSNIVVDAVILVNPNLDLRESHKISDKVEEILTTEFDIYDAHVHVEPKE
ncbi:MAG TPA: cation diffusion facilitator family transporter [Chondromyces sp.]|nr:cation diffusion facilitator family transporter [Chondromyces sp.]